jgi:hypothetical protein
VISGQWLRNRVRDAWRWPAELARQFPARMGRLAGIVTAGPGRGQAPWTGWLHAALWALFDLAGGPEFCEFFLRAATRTRRLTADEVDLGARVLGPRTVRLDQVRVAQGGPLKAVFERNGQRAFAAWHTVNLPDGRERDLPLLVHELIHVYQYERVGSVYIGQGLLAQRRLGRQAYHYGGPAGLQSARAAGTHFRDYNREQQGQIAQDYSARLLGGEETGAYESYMAELRLGRL